MDLSMLLPIPNLLEARNVLCIQPHPDDMDIAAGGTLTKLTGLGAHITLATVTDGSKGTEDPGQDPAGLVQTRKHEQEAAAKITGVQDLIWLPFADGEVPADNSLRNEVIRLIRQVKPDLVLTIDPFIPYEAHPDHLRTGQAVLAAALFSGLPRFAPGALQPHKVPAVALAQTNRPNTYIDVTAEFGRKLAAVGAHQSQFPPDFLMQFSFYLNVRTMEYGKKLGVDHAEAFKVLTPTHLHYNPDAEDC